MALAKKCDRCGKTYEHYPTNDVYIVCKVEKGETEI
jgi:hypothetical protein